MWLLTKNILLLSIIYIACKQHLIRVPIKWQPKSSSSSSHQLLRFRKVTILVPLEVWVDRNCKTKNWTISCTLYSPLGAGHGRTALESFLICQCVFTTSGATDTSCIPRRSHLARKSWYWSRSWGEHGVEVFSFILSFCLKRQTWIWSAYSLHQQSTSKQLSKNLNNRQLEPIHLHRSY